MNFKISHALRYWHLLLVAASVLFFVFRFIPAAMLMVFNADALIPLIALHQVIDLGRPMTGWAWGGAPFIPDLALVLAFRHLRGLLGPIAGAAIVIFFGWFAVFFAVYKLSGGRRPAVFAVLLAMYLVLIALRPGIWRVSGFLPYIPCYHGLTAVFSIGCLAIVLRSRQRGCSWSLVIMAPLIALGALSDPLLLVTFTGPALTALAAAAWSSGRIWRTDLAQAGNIAAASAAGVLLRPVLFPSPVPGDYTRFNPAAVAKSVAAIWADARAYPDLAVSIGLGVLFVLFCLATAMPLAPWNHRKGLSSQRIFLWAFAGSCVAMNWGAAILTGDYGDRSCVRYVMLALALPQIFVVALAADLIPWNQAAVRLVAVACSIAIMGLACAPVPPSGAYVEERQVVPFLKKFVADEHLPAGLGDYWTAHVFTYVSADAVKMGDLSPLGEPSHWFNNIGDFTGYKNESGPPVFRFIYMGGLDVPSIRVRFGDPDLVVPAPGGELVWVYSPENAIRYSAVFNVFQNRHTEVDENTYRTPAAEMRSATGAKEGACIVAREGRDQQAYVTYGPYLHAAPGRYRIDYEYEYEKPPAPGREAVYDCSVTLPSGAKVLDHAPLPLAVGGAAILSREIVIPDFKVAVDKIALEARVCYLASGDIKVKSLTITRIGDK